MWVICPRKEECISINTQNTRGIYAYDDGRLEFIYNDGTKSQIQFDVPFNALFFHSAILQGESAGAKTILIQEVLNGIGIKRPFVAFNALYSIPIKLNFADKVIREDPYTVRYVLNDNGEFIMGEDEDAKAEEAEETESERERGEMRDNNILLKEYFKKFKN